MADARAWAVVVAAGVGRRFGGSVRKPYVSVAGRPLVWYSLRLLLTHPDVAGVVLVVHAADVDRAHRAVRQAGGRGRTIIVCGGTRRQDSVQAGLAVLSPRVRWVLIHDVARPLVTRQEVTAVLKAARRHGAAVLAARAADTTKRDDGRGRVLKTVPRSGLWLAYTPQAFNRTLLERAFERWGGMDVTDDAMLVERLGRKVVLVEGSRWNMKVTTRADVKMVHALLVQGRRA